MRPLCRELMSQYELNIKKYQYVRSNYYLETNKGKFLLRKTDLTKEQINFCYEVDTHLARKDFNHISNIYPTKKKLPYALLGEDRYIMHWYVPCDETNFQSEEDLKGIIRTLAQFHMALIDVESKYKSPEQMKIKNIYEYYKKRQSENNKIRKSMLGLKQKSSFELMFLEGCNTYRELEELALSSINKEMADRLIGEVCTRKTIAHKDFTYHTVNKTENEEYIISQIDTCSYDIQVMDLAQILSKMMQKNDWNKELLYDLIATYNKEKTLSKDEMDMLKFMMIYPEKYNSICFRYISSKRRWNYSMFEQKWMNMLAYSEKQVEAAKKIQSW